MSLFFLILDVCFHQEFLVSIFLSKLEKGHVLPSGFQKSQIRGLLSFKLVGPLQLMSCFSVVTFEKLFFVFSFHKSSDNVSWIPLSLSFKTFNLALAFRFIALTKFVKFSAIISLHTFLVPLLSSLLLRLDERNVNWYCKF